MIINWNNNKIKKTVENLAKSDKKVDKRMIVICAAKSFLDLIPASNGRAHFLKGNLVKLFALDVTCKKDPKRYICRPYGDFEKDQNDNYKKETIIELLILKIEDHYKK